MAKSPKKSGHNSKSISQAQYKKNMPSKVGGKKIKAYSHKKNFIKPPQRRFSIADTNSSSSHSESENGGKNNYYETRNYNSASDSDSSLTEVTDNDEAEASRKGSVFFESTDDNDFCKPIKKSPKKSEQNNNCYQSMKSAKKSSNIAKKRTPKKTVSWNQWDNQFNENAISEGSESSSNEVNVGLGGLYSMMNHQKQVQSESDKSESESESNEEEHDYSSSDDSDVDFVKLQAERKANSMKAVKAMKGLSKQRGNQYRDDSDSSEISDHVPKKKLNRNRRRSSSMSKPRFGRRKSEVALPDINFTFEFDDYSKFDNAIIDEEDEEAADDEIDQINNRGGGEQEEDIGEEVSFAVPNSKKQLTSKIDDNNNDNATNHNFGIDFDFIGQLPQVPRINDTELNSDEDYEIDDNELLATLQADNDMDQFSTPGNPTIHTRNNSIGSYGDEEENDPFLKEEEKFLVNEFENNGFDEDESINMGSFDYNDPSDRDNLIDSFNVMNSNQNKDVIQYASSVDSESDEEEEDDDEGDEDEYDDFIDFDARLFDKDEEDDYDLYEEIKVSDQHTRKHLQNKKKRAKSRKRTNGMGNSDEEDDSYLWNYFFSSDNSSQSSDDEENYRYDDSEERVIMEKLFKNMEKENRTKKLMRRKNKLIGLDKNHYIPPDNEYESGESTDVDMSLPPSTDEKSGSKMAKEVLSSKTADYRPPVLGTWVAIDSKPFGIIDGLSTRSLGHNNLTNNASQKQMEPRLVSRKGIAPLHPSTTDDLALGLDELLNVSELDDHDENDARIWRDFNNQKKQVPLGAFRNKSILQNQLIHPDNVTVSNNSSYNHTSKSNNEFNKRRYSLSNHQTNRNALTTKHTNAKKPIQDRKSSLSASPTQNSDLPNKSIPSKLTRRRASIVEAVSEGFRPTKSGLFSEDALADVEEILGEDNDLMGLIKGL